MKGITVFETLTDIREDYIRDAELDACFLTAPARKRGRNPSAFRRFMNSGWGVAIICAFVAVSVMGGIIWAGNRPDGPGIRPPVGNQLTEDLTFEQETMETIDPPAAEIAAKAPEIAWEKPVKSVQTTAFYSMVTYNMIAAGDNQITEISLATHEDDTRTLMFRLINRETYEVMAHYRWDATEGKWGVMTVEEGIFLVYRTTEQGAMTTLWIDFFVWLPELDLATYECVGSFYPKILPESRPYLWKHPRVEDTGEWGRFVKEWFTDFPTTYLCMDEALGDLTFYTEDNRYTDGWERMRLFWQDLCILDGEETTGGLEIVTEAVGPEDIVTEWSGNETEAERAMEMYAAAIRGEICVFDERLGEVKLEDCRFPSYHLRLGECEILSKAILDMDGDGINEYVIQSETKDHIVLHYYHGKVYSYCFDYRNFYNLNTDGSFYWSDSYESENWSRGLNQIAFNGSTFSIKEIYRIKHSRPHNFYEDLEFYVDGKQITSEEFSDYHQSRKAEIFSPLDISCEYPISSEKAYELASKHWGFESGMSEGASGTQIVHRIVILEKPTSDTLSYRICWQMEGYRNHVPDIYYSLPPKSVVPHKELLVDAITGECREYIDTEDNPSGESLDVVYSVSKQGIVVILDFKPDHTVKITVQGDGYLPTDGWDIQEIFMGEYHFYEGFITLDCPEALGSGVYMSHIMNGTFSFTEVQYDGYSGVWIGDAFFTLADARELEILEYNRN